MQDAVIVSAVRTAVGKANKGALAHVRPEELGTAAVREAVRRAAPLAAEDVDDVIMGCAMPEGPQGLNMGRIIALRAGLPDSVTAQTVNRFCSSGLQSIALGAQQIMAGMGDVIVAGGTESMSAVPMSGFCFRPDPWMAEHLPEAYVAMGITAENVARKFGVSREDADAFASRSHERALAAIRDGKFKDEIVPLEVERVDMTDGERRTSVAVFDVDEGPRHGDRRQQLPDLRRRRRRGRHVAAQGRGAGPRPAGALRQLRGGRRGAGGDGHRPGEGDPQGARVRRPEGRRP
jgi:acetyl-CoA acyltransferase